MQEQIEITAKQLREYLVSLYNKNVSIDCVCELGKKTEEAAKKELKGFGYGKPYLIEFTVDGKKRSVVLETLRVGGGFGHDHFSDRAQVLIWQHSTFNRLPRHVRSIDVGAFTKDRRLKSVGDCTEFFIITELVEGQLYHVDLDRMKETQQITKLDIDRCKALSDYLAKIHKVKTNAPELYARKIRDLVGHGECIFGLTDSYPLKLPYISQRDFVEIEKKCVEWRWKLKPKMHRLSQVHGDFHPWNIMFRKGVDFTLLDRSRGEWGEPADDVSALTVNYLFYSLQAYGKLDGPFERLFTLFWKTYLDKTGDEEILSVIQPFYAWRGLVVASPVWYPHLPLDVRKKLFNFIREVLEVDKVELKDINSYFLEK
ncbi:MAG TPA: phosphotransferase [Candidatus Krumholzibacteriaceae bacterium]|nr:phosphotransferase [Candidatus Krumholzibacteriaceae bacterium]